MHSEYGKFICRSDHIKSKNISQFGWQLALVLGVATLGLNIVIWSDLWCYAQPAGKEHTSQLGQQFQVPYRLTDTNHFLVRARINGKGPFNFLVDSGAPALFIATATAKKIGMMQDRGDFWTPIDCLELEGGCTANADQGSGGGSLSVSGYECPWTTRCVH